jgi:AcrR family transcriptional regulator
MTLLWGGPEGQIGKSREIMPRKQRKPSEVDAFRKAILNNAVELMDKVGFEGFTMKRLAQMMGLTAPAIYSYYRSKDELYLVILTEGFQMLYNRLKSACRKRRDPFDQARAFCEAYVDFGLQNAHFYNLMFTWRGTALEEAARNILVSSQQVRHLGLKIIKACADEKAPLSEEEARFLLVYIWSALHGYIAGIHNTLIYYMHKDPLSLRERTLDLLEETFRREIEKRTGRVSE